MTPSSSGSSGPGPAYIITARALALIAGRPGVRARLDVPSTLVITGRGTGPGIPAGWRVTPAASFTGFSELQAALEGGRLPSGTKTVIYDLEGWSLTPDRERRDPAGYLARAAALAHAHGLTFVAAPAVDLTPFIRPGAHGYQAYLDTGLLAAAARRADVVVVQAQGSIPAPAAYAAFVRSAVTQIRSASTSAWIVAGLSTGASGQQISIGQLRAAVAGTRDLVQGYWINIPARSQFCPGCGQARPDLAEQLLAGS